MVGPIRRPLLLLLGAVVLVFAIVIANVTSLELARTIGRGREFAVRGALGAGRTRLIRQLVAESLCLAALGAGIGFALAGVLIAAIRTIAPPDLPRLAELGASGPVLGFAIGASLVAALVTGVVPILIAGRRGTAVQLTAGGRSTALPGVRRLQVGLVVAQIGLSVVLLIGAGLLIRSFVAVLDNDRGFRTDGVALLTVQSWSYLPKPADRVAFVAEVSRRLAARPGIEAAGMATAVPLMEAIGSERTPLIVEGAPPTPANLEAPDVAFAAVTPGFFAVLGIPLQEGRYLDDQDRDIGLKTVVVNEAFVRRHLDGIPPIGARIRLGRPIQGVDNVREIVGVVGNVRQSGLVDAAEPAVYVPHSQSGSGALAFMVRTRVPSRAAHEHIKQVIWELQPTMPVYRESTMAGLVGAAVRDRRFVLMVLGGFASLALLLAGAGIFGLMSFLAEERVREIGVRMALGATRGQVVGMLLGTGGRLAAIGIALGLVGAVAITGLLGGMLYQVEPLDPVTFVGAAMVLGVAALAATWFPANRAARTDPVDALRFD
jgi:predicted permease